MLKIAGNDEMSLSNDCACGGCPFPLSAVVSFSDRTHASNYKLDRTH